MPTSVAGRGAVSPATWTWNSLAFPATCAFVTMLPDASSTTPEPSPSAVLISTTEGIISATDRAVTEPAVQGPAGQGRAAATLPGAIQTSAPINPGNSGPGPDPPSRCSRPAGPRGPG